MATVDVVIRGGEVFDGLGGRPRAADVVVDGDRVAAVGDANGAHGRLELDARGLAVAPGFINMLSWATESLLIDGRSLSDLHQGVTLEVFGEGVSMGPLTDEMRERMIAEQVDLEYDVEWTTLREYLAHLERVGVSTNVASFVGATTARIHEVGYADRPATPRELRQMRRLVREAMAGGALGVGSSLIYAPASYAGTEELIALAGEAGAAGGMYISHMRSEGSRLLEATRELLSIARDADLPAEIYHFKALGAAGLSQWARTLETVEAARNSGLRVTADAYPYPAAATGLDAAMPPWVQEGGLAAWFARLRDPSIRRRVVAEMRMPDPAWENQVLLSGGPENVLLTGFKNERLKPLTGRTIASVAMERGVVAEDAIVDLVIEDESRVSAIYFNQSEEILRQVLALPWVSLGSDEASLAPEGVFLRSNPHPRAYGTFARFLSRYVRDAQLVPLQEAVRRLTSLPAGNLGLAGRGRLQPGAHADVVIFDPRTVADGATFERPHQLAVGVEHVLVNGVAVLLHGEHTGARTGRALAPQALVERHR